MNVISYFIFNFVLVYFIILGTVFLFSRKKSTTVKFSLLNIWAFIGALGNTVFRLLDKLN